jgi:hypothetical protein
MEYPNVERLIYVNYYNNIVKNIHRMEMNKEETKILRYLSDSLGNGGNIHSMSDGIRKKNGPAYYPNIYNTIMRLEKRGIISIIIDGNNRLIRLDMKNPLSIYYISEAENQKTMEIEIQEGLMNELLDLALDSDILTMCSLKHEKHIKINRIELLIITRSHNQDSRLISDLLKIESLHNTRIDPIILTPNEFSNMLGSDNLNSIKDLITDKSILYNSEGFWGMIRKYKLDERFKNQIRFPDDLRQPELAYNYNKFGYGLYEETESGTELSLEDTIFLMNQSKEIRIRYGALILLKKNIRKINLLYLYYTFKRRNQLSTLKSILSTLKEFCDKEDKEKLYTLEKLIPNKKSGDYDKNLIKKYLLQYG